MFILDSIYEGDFRSLLRLYASLVVIVLAHASNCVAQEVSLSPPFPDSGRPGMFLWDAANTSLIFYRDVADNKTPGIRCYQDGLHAGTLIIPSAELPENKGLDVWTATGLPNAGVVASAVVHVGPKKVQYLLLTYDALGDLQRVWDVSPYHHQSLASDEEGNVYAFGERIDVSSNSAQDYPLIIKYSPAGEILAEALPRSLFASGTTVSDGSDAIGDPQLFVVSQQLVLFVPATSEVFYLDRNGKLMSRRSLTAIASELTAATGAAQIRVWRLVPTTDGQIIVQFRLWRDSSTKNKKDSKSPFLFALVQIRHDWANWFLMVPIAKTATPGSLLGVDRTGRLLFLKSSARGEPTLATLHHEGRKVLQ